MQPTATIERSKVQVPWMMLIALSTALFFTTHYSWTASSAELFDPSADKLLELTSSGDLVREAILGALGALALWKIFTRRRIVHFRGALMKIVAAYVLWAVASIAWSSDYLLCARRVSVLAIVLLIAWWLNAEYGTEVLALFVFYSSAAYVAVGLVIECVLGTFHPLQAGYRFAGTLHPNHQAVYCALLALAGTALVRTSPRWLYGSGAVLGAVMLLLTRSRTAAGAFIGAQLAYWLLVFARKSTSLFLGTTLLAFALAAAGTWVFESGVMNTNDLLMGRDVETFTGRAELWQDLVPYVYDKPVTGYGFGAFWTPQHIDSISQTEGWGVAESHSLYMDIALALGIVGLALYGAVLVLGLCRAGSLLHVHSGPGTRFLFLLFVFVVIHGWTESAFLGTAPLQMVLFWGVFSLACAPERWPVVLPARRATTPKFSYVE